MGAVDDTIMPGITCKKLRGDDGEEKLTYTPLSEVNGGLIVSCRLATFEYISVPCPCGQQHDVVDEELVRQARALGTFVEIPGGDYPHPLRVLRYELTTGRTVMVDPTWPLESCDEATYVDLTANTNAGLATLLREEHDKREAEFAIELRAMWLDLFRAD